MDRCDNGDFFGIVHTTLERFESAALFQRLGPPPGHNKSITKTELFENRRNVKTPAFRSRLVKTFLEN